MDVSMTQRHSATRDRVLILGGLAGQVDAIKSLQSHGWEAHACGRDREGPALAEADGFHIVDIVDADAVTNLAEQLAVKFVYSVGSDIAMPTVSRVSERLGLPHFVDTERTDLLRDKASLRGFLAEHALSPVAFRRVQVPDDLDAPFPYPAMLKPVDSQGQRGITLVRHRDDAREALPAAVAASASDTAILEEYLDGPEVSVHVFLSRGKIAFYEPSDRHVWDGPLPGVAQGHTIPSQWVARRRVDLALRELVTAFVDALGISEGPLYFQLKLTERGPRIIEVAPRLDGCHLWRLINVLYGVDLLHACWAGLAQLEPPDLERSSRAPGADLTFHLVPPGQPVDLASLPAHRSGPVPFEEFHLDEEGMARKTNGVIARAGYRITFHGSEPS